LYTIGLFLGSTEDSYGQNILRGIHNAFRDQPARLLCFTSGSLRSYHGFEAQRNVLYRMVDRDSLDALIITGAISHHISSTDLQGFCADYYPLPLVTIEIAVDGVPGVQIDNRSGMKELMEHVLASHRYKQFFHLAGPRSQQEADIRREEFAAAMEARDLEIPPGHIIEGDYTIESGLSAAADLADRIVPGESVIVCANDSMALGLMEGLRERGFSIPDDVAVTGFDDSIDAQYADPPLTTVRQSTVQLAEKGARLALDLVEGRVEPGDASIKVPAKFILRQSCGCAPESPELMRNVAEELAGDSDARIRLSMERKLNQLRLLSEALITSIRLPDVLDVLEYELPQLGISSCYLSIFEDPSRESRQSRLLFKQRNAVREPLPPAGVRFDTTMLLPGGIASLGEEDWMVIVEALYSKDEKLGFAVFITDRYASALTGTIRSLLSGALQAVLLLDERRRHEKQLLDYQQRLKDSNIKLVNTLASLQSAQEQLAQSEQMAALGELVAGVTHDLRTPLGTAYTAATHLRSRGVELQRKFVAGSMTKSNLEDLLSLLDETGEILSSNLERAELLLDSFKTVAADQTGGQRRRFRLREYLDKVILSLKPQWKKYRVAFHIEGDEELELNSFPGAISHILANLIMNSLRHGIEPDQEANISISFFREDEQVILEYRDSGKGIPGDLAVKIFDPFFTTARERGGTGLGLNIVQNLARTVLGGDITLENPGEPGALFRLKMPMEGLAQSPEDQVLGS
jgi:DNA-binding LacI/PurR family transcriptional regulator/signal transduction histidine kinase